MDREDAIGASGRIIEFERNQKASGNLACD
jgi:hypothetical protein